MKQTKWWKDSVVYQIYPRSFQDSNGDGIGDIPGIISRLDYLKELGIDVIWLSPVYRSPQDDNGYDISDYRDIDPMFGTLSDMEELIREGNKRGIRIVMDLVANHSSDEHAWFVEARKGNPKYRDYYIWREGTPDQVPNALRASFGGSAWEWDEQAGAWYLHLFSKKQPDLNWENPAMRHELYDMINWWLDKGLGGFRLDVVELIGKVPDRMITANGPRLHEYVKEMSKEAFQKHDIVTVGETWNAGPEEAKLYSAPDGSELSMIFQFEHICQSHTQFGKWKQNPKDFRAIKHIMTKWQNELRGCGWNSLFWDNHDLPRAVSAFGDEGKYRVESAKTLALYMHGLQGTPYVYQGEELGMTNTHFNSPDEVMDIESRNLYHELGELGWSSEERMAAINMTGRDHARTPVQWDDTENAGFTQGTPWIPVNPNYREINAKAQVRDPGSVFSFYKALIALRRDPGWRDVLRDGTYTPLLDDDEHLFGYARALNGKTLLFAGNFSGEEIRLPQKRLPGERRELLLSVYGEIRTEGEDIVFRPYESWAAVCL